MFDSYGGVNYAGALNPYQRQELQDIFGTLVSDHIITVYRRTFNLHLILDISDGIDLCKSIKYLCEDDSMVADMSDSALDGPVGERQISAPKVKTFTGFCKGGFRYKFSVEQLECINDEPILQNWYNMQLALAIENGRNAIMARWYRQLTSNVHPKNTGNNAGMTYGGNRVGSATAPVLFNPENADKWFMAILATIKQMPKSPMRDNEFSRSVEGEGFIFGPSIMENVLQQSDTYNKWEYIGDCNMCSYFQDTFARKPRGILPITGDCVESYTCLSAGQDRTVYPVLFGKRFQGAKAFLRVKTYDWLSNDRESAFYQTMFYHRMDAYDCRCFGLGYIVIDQDQPELIEACA